MLYLVVAQVDENESAVASNLYHYQYDQLNRLLSMNSKVATSSTLTAGNYSEALTYDANGNIQSLLRKDQTNELFDELGYV